jgi:hypothetical protein
MTDSKDRDVVVRLNQQQLELVDRTIEGSKDTDNKSRAKLFRLALQEFHADHSS